MPTALDDPLMTTSEVAAFLKLGVHTIRRYTLSNKLQARRLPGGEFRYRREDVEALLDEKAI